MDRETIRGWITSLASSQGCYGRLLAELDENLELWDVLEEQEFNDPLDLIFYLEG